MTTTSTAIRPPARGRKTVPATRPPPSLSTSPDAAVLGGSRSLWVGKDPELAAIRMRAGKILARWVLTRVPLPVLEQLVQVMFAMPSVPETFPDTGAAAADCL
jgi:hypothetical protein